MKAIIRKILQYFYIVKKNPEKPDFNLKMMHGINRISIAMFLFAVGLLVVRCFKRM
ncbi:MAG: hypothetical protein NTX03_13295 [Bacteroidetes bacterium]|nr:hypothetical protein [Bacteroidota bacterium]